MAGRYGNSSIVQKNDYGGSQVNHVSSSYRQQTGSQQNVTKTSYVDKQTGNYSRVINKEVVSTGDTFKERSTGRVGYKDEYKTTSTYRVGNKGGYSEYQCEERYRVVNYGGSGSGTGGSSNYNGGSNYNNRYSREDVVPYYSGYCTHNYTDSDCD